MSSSAADAISKSATSSPTGLLDGLTQPVRTMFLAESQKVEVRANAQLFVEGHSASQLFLLMKGHVKYFRLTPQGKQVILWWLGPGDAFGLGTMLADPPPYIGTAESVSACELLCWPQASVRTFAMAHPQIACNALSIVLHYLGALSDRHAAFLGNTANDRVARVLLNLGRRKGHVQPHGVDLDITNEELASLADVSPFTVSRTLSELHRKGALTKRRKVLTIHSPEALVPPSR
jgi:CRP/FNR family transcriptional regulator, nitrogen oxide reductase regulator